MNLAQAEAIQKIFAPHRTLCAKPSRHSIVIEHKRGYKDLVAFEHKDPNCLMAYLWHKTPNTPLVLHESNLHKVVVTPHNNHGVAQFIMQLEVRNSGYTTVENILSLPNTVSRTSQANFPRQVHETMREQWFQDVRNLIKDFNKHQFYA